MELNEIIAFVTIHRTGSFTHAAELLHLSQPAVSRRIELLECDVQVPLFERLPSGVRLTEAGMALLPFAQQVLAAIEDGRAAVRAVEERAEGAITLALVGTLASSQLTEHVRTFRTLHPHVRLLLRTGRSDEVSTLVREGDAQLGLRYFADPRPDICSIPVIHEPLVVVCAATSQLVGENQSDCAALHGVPWVTYPSHGSSSGEPFARLLERLLLQHGLDDAERVVIDSLTAQKRLIEADFGVGLLPKSSIEEELLLGTLRILPIASMRASVPIVAIHRRKAYLSRACRAMLAGLTEHSVPFPLDAIHSSSHDLDNDSFPDTTLGNE